MQGIVIVESCIIKSFIIIIGLNLDYDISWDPLRLWVNRSNAVIYFT